MSVDPFKPRYVVFWQKRTIMGRLTRRIYVRLVYGDLALKAYLEELSLNPDIVRISYGRISEVTDVVRR